MMYSPSYLHKHWNEWEAIELPLIIQFCDDTFGDWITLISSRFNPWTLQSCTLTESDTSLWLCLTPSLTGGSATPRAARKKTACPPRCPGRPASELPPSPLQRWTPRPSSKRCSSPPRSPARPRSPRAHRPPPSASRSSFVFVFLACLHSFSVSLQFSSSSYKLSLLLDCRPPAFPHTKLITFFFFLFQCRITFSVQKSWIQCCPVSSWDGPAKRSLVWDVVRPCRIRWNGCFLTFFFMLLTLLPFVKKKGEGAGNELV